MKRRTEQRGGKGKAGTEPPAQEIPATERQALGDTLRQAITNSGLGFREIERQAAIGTGQVSRFMARDRDLTLDTADKVAAVLGLHLSSDRQLPRASIPTLNAKLDLDAIENDLETPDG